MDRFDYIELLKTLADESRLNIIKALQNGPKTAGEIEKIIGKSQSSTSQQLKKLVDNNLLIYKREWNEKYFEVKDKQIFQVINSLESYVQSNIFKSTFFQKGEKVLFLGMSGSGKTSLLISLLGIKHPISDLKPTTGLKLIEEILKENKIMISNGEISIQFFEGGGSKNDRDELLKNPNKILFDFDKIAFVIDIQNKEGPIPYINTLNYLKDIIYIAAESKKLKEFLVFLHKNDIELETNSEINGEFINEKLINPIKKAMPPEFNYRIFKTSIIQSIRSNLVSQSYKI